MCRSIPLGRAAPGVPDLWLEVRPTRAFAAQPKIDAAAVTITVGVQAETRIAPTETRPDCPFPVTLELVPPLEQGRVSVGVPVDLPFTEVNKLIEAQLEGRTFPENGSGNVAVTINHAELAASGDRLLISPARQGRARGRVGSASAPTPRCMSGASPYSIEPRRCCALRRSNSMSIPRSLTGCSARPPARDPVSQERARRECAHRSQAVRRQCAPQHRVGARGLPHERAGRAGGGGDHRVAACRHRIRCRDAAHCRGSRRQREDRDQCAAWSLIRRGGFRAGCRPRRSGAARCRARRATPSRAPTRDKCARRRARNRIEWFISTRCATSCAAR